MIYVIPIYWEKSSTTKTTNTKSCSTVYILPYFSHDNFDASKLKICFYYKLKWLIGTQPKLILHSKPKNDISVKCGKFTLEISESLDTTEESTVTLQEKSESFMNSVE